jgi:protein SCO1/2
MTNPSPADKPAAKPATSSTGRFPGAAAVFAVVALLAVGLLVARQYFGGGPAVAPPQTVAGVKPGGPFALTDQDGRALTDADFRGRYMLIYFGFTYCPDVCPTSLARNADALALIGDKAAKVTPILISVDPERDTPAALKAYAQLFGGGLVGLTGTPQQIADVARAYRVYYAKVAASDSGSATYLIDHSAFTYLMGPDGQFIQLFRHDLGAIEMAQQLRELIR